MYDARGVSVNAAVVPVVAVLHSIFTSNETKNSAAVVSRRTLCFRLTNRLPLVLLHWPWLVSLRNNPDLIVPHLSVTDRGFHLSVGQDCVLSHLVISVSSNGLKGGFWAIAGPLRAHTPLLMRERALAAAVRRDVRQPAAALRPLFFFKSFTQLLAPRQLEHRRRNSPLLPHCLLAYEFLSAQQSERTLCAHTGQEQRKWGT